jgi:ribosome modulation factor
MSRTDERNRLKTAFKKGYYSTSPREENPYRAVDTMHAWWEGWDARKEQEGEDDPRT